jgi:hypothetical protein
MRILTNHSNGTRSRVSYLRSMTLLPVMLSIFVLVGACGSSRPNLITKIFINEATDASGQCLCPGAKYLFEGIIGPPKSLASLRAAHSISKRQSVGSKLSRTERGFLT